MYPVMSLLMIGVGIVLVFSAKKVSQKNVAVAGMSGILGTFMIVAGLGALWFLMTGRDRKSVV